jgi:AraC-like DNA-binding protein
MTEQSEDRVKFWVAHDLDGTDLVRASYVKHAFPRHFHETYVIIVQERGVDEFYCRGELRHSPAGSIALVNPHEVHTGRPATEEPWVYRAIYPHPTLVKEVVSHYGERTNSQPYFSSPVVYDLPLARSLYRLHHLLETSPDSLERQTAFVVTLAQLIGRHSGDQLAAMVAGSEPRAIKTAREYIEAHYAENLSLSELASVAHLSPSYLVRAFHKEVGLPPHEFLTQVRVKVAKKFLSEGRPIVEVALEAGFVDQSHFTNRFKRLVGITPKQFARQSKL